MAKTFYLSLVLPQKPLLPAAAKCAVNLCMSRVICASTCINSVSLDHLIS